MSEQVRVIFVTNQFGPHHMSDDEGLIGTFQNTHNNLMENEAGIKMRNPRVPEMWVMILTDPKKIERAKKYPGFGTSFNITSKEPVYNTITNLRSVSDPNAFNNANTESIRDAIDKANREKEEFKKQTAIDSRRYAILSSKLIKEGGKYRVDADPALIQEFEALKIKLGIEELAEELTT